MIYLAAFLLVAQASPADHEVRVGSKVFTESVILGDLATQMIRAEGGKAVHRRELGGTQILFHALEADELDVYPEYTGTISGEILAGKVAAGDDSLRAALKARGIGMSRPLGFNNTYAIGMREDVAARLGIVKLSDLAGHPTLKFGFGNEFMERADGWPGLRDRYRLPQRDTRGLDHDLAYRALEAREIDATELYSTDAEIKAQKIRVLADDEGFFPPYQCVLLHRLDLERRSPEAFAALKRLEGTIDEGKMIAMNARAKFDRVPEERVAADFLASRFGINAEVASNSRMSRILSRLVEHMGLVSVSLTLAILAAIPLGIVAAKRPRIGAWILGATSVIQTIPSLALLVFMIPWLGIGAKPALVALFLYSLLPIVRSTATGLLEIPPSLRESAQALGLPAWARLRLVELPMATRGILSGIKTAAVINVGTATIGALIGAGGFGQPILTGIRRDDLGQILFEGAIPSAILALAVQTGFDLAERWLVPRGMKG
ncbi:glycine betaine ABC transporter substrate-binding protein [Isosphaeraceae bacterium EP7]